jgi:hypothetical protein
MIPDDGFDTFDSKYTRAIMKIPKDIFDVDKTINRLVITGYHKRSSRNQFEQDPLGISSSIETSTGDDDESPKRYYLTSETGMILKLDEILKAKTNTVRQLDLILKMLELIEHHTQRPDWMDTTSTPTDKETIPAPVNPQP